MQKVVLCLLEKIHQRSGETMLMAVDGRCAAGKTTLAARLQRETGCSVIHMDDFFLRPEQRTERRIQESGGNVDHERFLEEVMLPLSRWEPFTYRKCNCKQQTMSPAIQVEPGDIVIIEGSYSCHPVLWDYYDFRVFLDIDPEEQLRRIRQRNGNQAVPVFRDRWIPLEEQYFDAYQVRERCDLIYTSKSISP